jgi:hypothetical protein
VSRTIQSSEEGPGRTAESTEAPSRSAQTARLTIYLDQETSSFLKAMATVLRCNRPEDYAHDLIVRGMQEDARRIDSVFEQSSSKKVGGKSQ